MVFCVDSTSGTCTVTQEAADNVTSAFEGRAENCLSFVWLIYSVIICVLRFRICPVEGLG